MPTAAQMLARATRVESHDAAASLFQDEWQIYRKVVENNYFFHRQAYAVLREVLTGEMPRPFRFLDIACGDARDSVRALMGTRVVHYQGIDLSQPALNMARTALQALSCSVTLERRDFVAALRDRSIPADIAWIGLSLHHLQMPQKLALMCDLRLTLGEAGKLLVYEPSGPDGDTRAAWLKRWDRQRTAWRALTPVEWHALRDHSHANDYPETHVTWLAMGYEAGFGRARCLYESPTQLFRLYCFDS